MKIRSLVTAASGGFVVSIRNCLILILAMTVMPGCGTDGSTAINASAGRTDSAELRPDLYGIGARDALRIRKDALRNRLWVLALDEVRVYDTARAKKRLIRTIALPNWSVVGFRHVCMPDLALDRAGSAFISSNGQAKLWRIDSDSFDPKGYEITFHGNERWDIGFGALVFTADGTLLGRTTPGGWLWKIDYTKASAVKIELNNKLPLDECAFTEHLVTDT